jgi:hypothetical protein
MYISPGSDHIPAELIQAEGEIFLPVIHKLINYIWNKEEFLDSLIVVLIQKRVIKLSVFMFVGYHCYQLHLKFYRIASHKSRAIR